MEGIELLCFLPILFDQRTKCACSHDQWSLADFQYGQMVKSHFAVWSSSKSDSQNFLAPVLAGNTMPLEVTTLSVGQVGVQKIFLVSTICACVSYPMHMKSLHGHRLQTRIVWCYRSLRSPM